MYKNEIIKLENEIKILNINIDLFYSNKTQKQNKNKIKEMFTEINLKKTTIEETKFKSENIDINDDDIFEEDWINLLKFYSCIKKLKSPYKDEFEKIKHLRNEKILDLLDKLDNESKRMINYLSDKSTDYPAQYWSKLSIKDFYIL